MKQRNSPIEAFGAVDPVDIAMSISSFYPEIQTIGVPYQPSIAQRLRSRVLAQDAAFLANLRDEVLHDGVGFRQVHPASARVLEKAGFELEGTLRSLHF